MPDASFVQSNFLGGEWSPYAQGRYDHPKYRTALALCLNAIPVEEGACPRRPGFAFVATTRGGAKGRVLPFDFTDTAPYEIELTASHLRIVTGNSLVFTDDAVTVANISTGTPAVVTVSEAVDWATDDQVQFLFTTQNVTDGAILRHRQFSITVLNTTQFSLADNVTNAPVDGATINYDPTETAPQIARVVDLSTPYTDDTWPSVRAVLAASVGPLQSNVALLLQSANQPQSLNAIPNPGGPETASFSIAQQPFTDGPYLDYPAGSQLTANATSGSITLVLSYQAWSNDQAYSLGDFVTYSGVTYESLIEGNFNQEPDTSPSAWQVVSAGVAVGPNGFQSTDVGRSIRLFSECDEWNSTTDYAPGDCVQYQGVFYIGLGQGQNLDVIPPTRPDAWGVTTSNSAYLWTWGVITAVNSPTSVTINLVGLNLLDTDLPITNWQLGIYSDTTGWPTCGCFYEGRLWLSGAVPNRVDASSTPGSVNVTGSSSNAVATPGFYNFSPTAIDGTVGDGNAISATFNSNDNETVYWIEPVAQGSLAAGTRSGEWLIQASQLGDPITPSSIQAHRQTKVGDGNVLPCHTPLTMVFVHKFGRLLFEFFPDVFSGKLVAPNLNVFSKHLTVSGIQEVAYQSELVPSIWARTGIGQLIGWTYRRISQFSNEEPAFVGAHQHQLGSGRVVESLIVVPDPDDTLDTPSIVSNQATSTDPQFNVRHIETMTPLMDPSDPLTDSWFVDDGVAPSGLLYSATGVTAYGLWHLNGENVAAVIGGLDCGNYTVSQGSIFVPWQSDPGKLFTFAYMQTLSTSGVDFGGFATFLDTITVTSPPAFATPQAASTPQTMLELTYPTTGVSHGADGGIMIPDWANNTAYLFSGTSANTSADGIRIINLTTGVEAAESPITTILSSLSSPDNYLLGNDTGSGSNAALGADGNLYFYSSTTNSGVIVKVNATSLALVASVGTDSIATEPSSTSFCAPNSLATCVSDANYLIEGSIGANPCWIAAMNTDTMTVLNDSNFRASEEFVTLVTGTPNTGTIYGIGTGSSLSSTHFYRTAVGGNVATTVSVAEITPAQIDAGWSTFTQVQGLAFDQTDGHLIAVASGSGGSSPAYIFKILADSGSILWKVPVNAIGPSLTQAQVAGGIFNYLSPTASAGVYPCYVINTLTGAVTSFNVTATVQDAGSGQVSDSVKGRLIMFGNYTSGGVAPTPISPTMTFTSQWGILTAGIPAAPFFRGGSSTTSRLTVPAVVGFPFTTQAQLLRPVVPQDAGAANGPSLGKTHRQHMFGILLAGAIYGTITIGTLFTKMRGLYFKTKGNVKIPTNQLFSGILWDTLENNYDFDSQLCWQISRPLPAHVTSIGGFINTQDR